MTKPCPSDLHRAAELIKNAQVIWVIAGEGINAFEGQARIKSSAALWRHFPEFQDISWFDLNSASAFRRYPNEAWQFFSDQIQYSQTSVPNQSYAILRSWSEDFDRSLCIQTTNHDGIFRRIGFNSTPIYEMQGSYLELQCNLPCCTNVWSYVVTETSDRFVKSLPTCPRCGGIARPACLLFDDDAWISTCVDQSKLEFDQWLESQDTSHGQLVILEIGDEEDIPILRKISERALERTLKRTAHRFEGNTINAHENKLVVPATINLIRINENAYQESDRHSIKLQGNVGEVLRQIDTLIR